MSNFHTAIVADCYNYVKKLSTWERICWIVFSPVKWWVNGYQIGYNAALQLVKSQLEATVEAKKSNTNTQKSGDNNETKLG